MTTQQARWTAELASFVTHAATPRLCTGSTGCCLEAVQSDALWHSTLSLPPLLQDLDGSAIAGEVLDTGNRTKMYDLSVVRLADPHHAQLAFINVTDSTKTVYTACSAQGSLTQLPSDTGEDPGSEANAGAPPCSPDTALAVNVSSETKWVSLQPGLACPEVEGIRVEVKGQVLSQGGDVSADQIADTSGRTNSSR